MAARTSVQPSGFMALSLPRRPSDRELPPLGPVGITPPILHPQIPERRVVVRINVTRIRSFVAAMAAICPSAKGGGLPACASRGGSSACQAAAPASYARIGIVGPTTSCRYVLDGRTPLRWRAAAGTRTTAHARQPLRSPFQPDARGDSRAPADWGRAAAFRIARSCRGGI